MRCFDSVSINFLQQLSPPPSTVRESVPVYNHNLSHVLYLCCVEYYVHACPY